ncbi:hypothetical protein [Stenotrophomonas sp. YAU14A_MKIMI4_1]|uniref:hypothetical protein n=1 Tax=Stenotrophomonas sp. YAU14A_MKIMI4_1 TaxID=2072408 RepID=UPI000D542199|nr:hypothetical protein [Stenotrophomonas sp. YAU14A_MKIMI4_1]AWH30914.1 hypothetical protein C1931_19310 [Stenotrophomonas sp. YAU14A_MKIMI4_1]
MAASDPATAPFHGRVCLRDYEHIGKLSVAEITPSGTLLVCRAGADARLEPVRGVLGQGRSNKDVVPMAYLSCEINDAHGTPDYATNLILMIDGKMMGDGFCAPRISWSRTLFRGSFKVLLDDGWCFESRYRRQVLREMWWRLNVGGTLDDQPVDFIEKLVTIVSETRPQWIAVDP